MPSLNDGNKSHLAMQVDRCREVGTMRRTRRRLAAVVFVLLSAAGLGAQPDFASTVDRIAADALKQPIAGALARAALGLAPREPIDLPVPADEARAIAGTFDSDDGPIELFACGERICFRSPDRAVRGTQKRRAPFVYDVGPEVVVRFDRRVERPRWAFVYSAGLLTDAKRRTK
jgi:hypothetical protein